MAITYSFIDGVEYGTNDINSIAQDLTGAGVAPFFQSTYSVSELNMLTEALVDKGVSLDGCKCTLYDSSGFYVKVEKGTIFFKNGVRLRVDGEGYYVELTPGIAGNIYAVHRPAQQTADIVFLSSEPKDGQYVMLAEISDEGILTDKRSFARSKIATFGSNLSYDTEFVVLDNPIPVKVSGGSNTFITRRLSDVNLSQYNYALITNSAATGLFDLKKGEFVLVLQYDDSWFGGNEYCQIGVARYAVYISGNVLEVYQTAAFRETEAYPETSFAVKLI